MIARLLVISALTCSFVFLGFSFRTPSSGSAQAQSKGDLLATIDAMQTTVAEQDERIGALEANVRQLESTVASLVVDSPESTDTANPDTNRAEVHEISGSLTIVSSNPDNVFNENVDFKNYGDIRFCFGQGGFADLKGLMPVVVLDGSGSVIATGETESGQYSDLSKTCEFKFSVKSVPVADFYTFRIGRREAPIYSYEEMEEMNWNVALSIG